MWVGEEGRKRPASMFCLWLIFRRVKKKKKIGKGRREGKKGGEGDRATYHGHIFLDISPPKSSKRGYRKRRVEKRERKRQSIAQWI